MNKRQRIARRRDAAMLALIANDTAHVFIVCRVCGGHMGGIKRLVAPEGRGRCYYQPSADGTPDAPEYGYRLPRAGALTVKCAKCQRLADVPVAQLRAESAMSAVNAVRDLRV